MAQTGETVLRLRDGMAFEASTGSGHTIILDAARDRGGDDRGPRPIELLLVGLGACTGMDVISILRKMRQPVTGYELKVRGERSADHPMIFTDILVEHVVYGRGVTPESVRRAVELSETRYCPVGAMLGKAATVTHQYRVVEDAAADASSAG